MTPVRQSQYSPSEGGHNRQVYLHPFFPTSYETSSSSLPATSSSCLLTTCQGGRDHHHQQRELADRQFPSSGSIDHSSLSAPATHEDFCSHNAAAATMAGGPSSSGRPAKWMPSKMRFMRKTMNSDGIDSSKPRKSAQLAPQDDQQRATQRGTYNSGSNNSDGAHSVRVCSDCNTTKTPLWRSGPRGPKSLCNACGIRQRKARKAMAAAALSSTGGVIPAVVTPAKVPKEKKQQGECVVPFKKRCKFGSGAETRRKELRVDEFTVSFGNNNPALHRVFPQDEKEAAMLLMALSCGLIR